MVVVVKAGGRVLEANWDKTLESVAAHAGKGLVFVHGGGDVVTRFERLMGIKPKFLISPQGIKSRFTDRREIEVYNMVMSGKLNKEIVARLNLLGAKAIGLSGADGALLRAERKRRVVAVDERGRKRIVEGGYTGRIKSVNADLVKLLIFNKYIIVVAPVALGDKGELLNVDADQAAAALAAGLNAEKLIILTDVEGVIVNGKLIEEITPADAERLYEKIGYGMNRKVMACFKAVDEGVREAIISSGLVEDPIDAAEKGGTHIIPEKVI